MIILFEGKAVFVTGGTSGIEAEASLAFGQAGADVLVSGRNDERGSKICGAIRSAGGTATLLIADLADHTAVTGLPRQALDMTSGHIDVVINAAGAGSFKPSLEVTSRIKKTSAP